MGSCWGFERREGYRQLLGQAFRSWELDLVAASVSLFSHLSIMYFQILLMRRVVFGVASKKLTYLLFRDSDPGQVKEIKKKIGWTWKTKNVKLTQISKEKIVGFLSRCWTPLKCLKEAGFYSIGYADDLANFIFKEGQNFKRENKLIVMNELGYWYQVEYAYWGWNRDKA
jgi:hypothetical protein